MLTQKKSQFSFMKGAMLLIAIPVMPGSHIFAQAAHEHGVATLNVVREEQQVQIEFASPVANLLGFERMPESAEEWTLFATIVEEFESSEWLLGEALADCNLTVEALELPSFSSTDGDHGHDHVEEEHHEHEEESADTAHVDFRMQYLFDCTTTVPRQLQVVAFQRYPAIERIDTQWIIERRPGFSQLTPASPVLSLE